MDNHKIILDTPAEQPALQFSTYASAFKNIIESGKGQFAVGIFGGWGSGKTTLMRTIEKQLDDHTIPVWFSAWRYEKEQHLIIPLLDTLREALVEWGERTPGTLAVETAATVGKVIYSVLAGLSVKIGIPHALELSLDANKALARAEKFDKENTEVARSFYHASFRALNEAFSTFLQQDPQRRIVVFIDDLDRCLPESALDVIESMKLFFDLPGFVFVVGLDNRVIEAAVEVKYGSKPATEGATQYRISGTDYIKKIFQVPFKLFPVSRSDLDEYLTALYNEAQLPAEQQNELNTTVRPHLDYLVTPDGFNPREIRRYINAFTLIRKLKSYLDPNVVLALQTIEFRSDWILVRQGLYGFRNFFIESLKNHVIGPGADALQNLDRRFVQLPAEFLEYVGAGKPAHPLLDVGAIEEYIYAGEATSAVRQVSKLSDKVRDVSGLRAILREQLDNTELSARMESQLASVNSTLRQSDGPADPYTLSALRIIDQIKRMSIELKRPDVDRGQWENKVDALIDEAIQSLLAATNS